MDTSRELAARNKLGESIQAKSTSVNKQIERLTEEMNNLKSKASASTYTPDGMPGVTIPMSAEDKGDMLTLGIEAEIKIRALADSLKAFIESASN